MVEDETEATPVPENKLIGLENKAGLGPVTLMVLADDNFKTHKWKSETLNVTQS